MPKSKPYHKKSLNMTYLDIIKTTFQRCENCKSALSKFSLPLLSIPLCLGAGGECVMDGGVSWGGY